MEGIIEKSSSNHKLVLDNYCKLIICHEEILSRIAKCFIDEAQHLTLNEIERLIKEKKSFQHLDKENFNTFNEKIFSDEVDLSKYKFNISPRKNIINIKNKCIDFVNNFDNINQKNLLFTGNTGLR